MDNKNNSESNVIVEDKDFGAVQIADDVVATIAGLAATEVEGVYAMHTNITNEIVGKLGVKNLTKGVKITIDDNKVFAEVSITMKYGYSIPKTAKSVQDKVKSAIENMTGLVVDSVDVKISGVNIDNFN
jgi:uncharacterized alkaline shock family protein YloU